MQLKKTLFILLFLLRFAGFSFCQVDHKPETIPWKYTINIELKDSALLIDLNLKASKTDAGQIRFILFNRYIRIKEASLNGVPFKYSRSNDTMYVESAEKKEINLSMKYEIPYSKTESSKLISAYGDSTYAYPVVFDKSQLFCERFNKWYPVLYDNFSDYLVTITVPDALKAFAYYPESNCEVSDGKKVFTFDCSDEDFPFITPTDVFQQPKLIEHNNTRYKFYFLARSRRLAAITDNKPVFVSDSIQIDSLLNVTIDRSIAAIEWYNLHLWKQERKTLNFVETGILGLGAGLGNFILMDRILLNREAVENYALSHEIAHLWLGIHTEYLAKGKFFIGESVNEYVNLLFYRSWAGEDSFEKAIQDTKNLKYSDTPFYTVTFEQVLNQRKGDTRADDIIYGKGVAFAHEFQKMIGQAKFLKIIRETYSVPNHFVTLKDFESCIKANGCWAEYMKLYELSL